MVYSQNGKDEFSGGLSRYKGQIRYLAGGYDAWKSEIMGNPEDAYNAFLGAADSDSRRMVSAIHASFTGAKIEAPVAPSSTAVVVVGTPKKRGGCS